MAELCRGPDVIMCSAAVNACDGRGRWLPALKRLRCSSAACHWRPLTHVLMAALQAMAFSSRRDTGMEHSSSSAACHWPPLTQRPRRPCN
eukprot:4604529-Alexandrium_andersonii.AAC.1